MAMKSLKPKLYLTLTNLILILHLLDNVETKDQLGFKILLSGGQSDSEGFIEVTYNGQRSHICAHMWDTRNSRVLCRQLGFTDFVSNTTRLSNKIGNSRRFWSRVYQCQGRELSLSDCKDDYFHQFGMLEHCPSGSEVWLKCKNVSLETLSETATANREALLLRLKASQTPNHVIVSQGDLEVKTENKWMKVCSDGWTDQEARVACGQLGFPDLDRTSYAISSSVRESEIYAPLKFSCSGQESTLTSCIREGNYASTCRDGPVFLRCIQARDSRGELKDKKNAESGLVRLRAGHREFEGRVEVFVDGVWGTVCDDQWDIVDANVVCRQLGFGTAVQASRGAAFGEGTGPILLSSVNCTGSESSIRHCRNSRNVAACKHFNDAGVICRYQRPNFQKIRLTGSNDKYEGKVELYHRGQWYGICGLGFDDRNGRVVCRELGLGFVSEAYGGHKFGLKYNKLMFDVKCKGNEKSIRDCSHVGRRKGRCNYYSMAIVKCTSSYPDLVVDLQALESTISLHIVPMYELTCARDEKCLSSSAYQDLKSYSKKYKRKLLRFSARIMNKGTAAFLPAKRQSSWIWHSCHKHYHSMERFADFDIIDFYGRKVAEGHKASFCLEDTGCETGYQKVYNCTNGGRQGISVNCADNYKYTIDCQWVDLTDLKDGNYSLLLDINPQQIVGESDHTNNYATCEIDFYNDKIKVGRCSTDPCHVRSYGGTGYGTCCHFPFIFEGETYYECTTKGMGHSWCATTSNYDKDGKWGYCELQKALRASLELSENFLSEATPKTESKISAFGPVSNLAGAKTNLAKEGPVAM